METAEQKIITRQLGDLIDKHGLTTIFEITADICREKAEHIRVEWQDGNLAATWESSAIAIDTLAEEIRTL